MTGRSHLDGVRRGVRSAEAAVQAHLGRGDVGEMQGRCRGDAREMYREAAVQAHMVGEM